MAIPDDDPVPYVLAALHQHYPEAHCYLTHETPFQLLVATILSAQCTDARVNLVTPNLFKKYPTALKMSRAKKADLETLIRSTGFYHSKANSLLEMSTALVERHKGEVPNDLESLTDLRGVGRKTANVVLGNAYGVPSMVVDTHVGRIAFRLGLTKATQPEKVEQDLRRRVPESSWVVFSHLLIAHGRAICLARRARCEICFLNDVCPKRGVVLKNPSTGSRKKVKISDSK